mgnify:CR=1 FL=1|tara:strand:- start:1141 stop:2535 length:1395 start_codon:yes stop_codon:yes gene_type:complete
MSRWEPLDTVKLEEDNQIVSQAETDGGFNEPSSDSTILSSSELTVKKYVESYYSTKFEEYSSYFSGLETTILRSEALTMADGHKGQLAETKAKAEFLITELKAKIRPYKERKDFEEEALRSFKLSNNLVRPAVIKSPKLKFWLVVLVFFMFIFETTANTYLLSGAITGGIQGAIAFASVISFINIILSFMAGRIVIPQLHHKKKSKNNLAKLILCIYAPIIIYFNFAMGVFRSISEAQETTFTAAAIQDAAVKSVLPFSNMDVLTIASIGLIAIGIIFAMISLLDGYQFDDPYPKYGSVNERAKVAREDFNEECQKTLKEFSSNAQEAQNQISQLKEDRLEANVNWGLCIDGIQDGFIDYQSWTTGLISSGIIVVKRYRAVNSKFRSTPQPAYFDEDMSFSIETNPDVRIANLKEHHMSDKDKMTIISKNNDVITKEYNLGMEEVSRFFEDRNSELEDYIRSLG